MTTKAHEAAAAEDRYTIPEVSAALERGPVWLRERRHAERAAFNDMPLPRRGLHLWRYTDPKRFVIDGEVLDATFDDVHGEVEKLELRHFEEGHLSALAIDHGGRQIACHTSEEIMRSGVTVAPLSEAIDSHHDVIEEYLYSQINSRTGKFESLNGALWNDGVFLYVPDNAALKTPAHLLHEIGGANSATFPRTLIVVGENAEVTIVDEYGGGPKDRSDGLAYSNGAIEIIGLADSRTRYLFLQRQTHRVVSYLTHRAHLAQGASMITIPFSFGAALSKQNFGVTLGGSGADSRMYGLMFGSGRQHFDNHTLHKHSAGQTYSDIDFKVVLRDRAESAYTGLIAIDHDAQTCEAYQENRNLLLTPGTKAETIPELEILNEDVSCSHGATVGPIDEMQVFYLMCRGIPRDQAVRMVVSGFVQSTVGLAPEDLRERLHEVIQERLVDL